MKPWKLLAPFALLALGGVAFYLFVLSKPKPDTRRPPRAQVVVDVVTAERDSYVVKVPTQGLVRAHTESSLAPEVSGRIVAVAPGFRDGGFFEEGEVLVELDPRDYETALLTSEAALAQARLRLAEEEARSFQAGEDWTRLNRDGEPTSLVLREPQLLEARANVGAAEARLEKAQRDLERTRIRAPYAGRILSKNVDVGQFVNTGTALAEVYAVDYAEVRVPLADWQLPFVNLPEQRRGDAPAQPAARIEVTLRATVGNRTVEWPAYLVRTEGAIDASSRQLFAVAQVDDPYGPQHRLPLKVGMFVQAEITGKRLDDVWTIPVEALRKENMVLRIDDDRRMFREEVEVLWQDDAVAVLAKDTFDGPTRVSVTPVSFVSDGVEVVVSGDPRPERGGPGGAGRVAAMDRAPKPAVVEKKAPVAGGAGS